MENTYEGPDSEKEKDSSHLKVRLLFSFFNWNFKNRAIVTLFNGEILFKVHIMKISHIPQSRKTDKLTLLTIYQYFVNLISSVPYHPPPYLY